MSLHWDLWPGPCKYNGWVVLTVTVPPVALLNGRQPVFFLKAYRERKSPSSSLVFAVRSALRIFSSLSPRPLGNRYGEVVRRM